MQHINYIFIFIFAGVLSINAQESEVLTTSKAVKIALENNYGIKIANNNVEVAKNNASIYNTGYLPKVSATAGANISKNDSEFTLQDGTSSNINNADSKSFNTSIGINYVLFDGFGRSYNYKKLQESHNLSKLEARAVIENSLLQLFSMYFEISKLTEESQNINESLIISKDRLKRAYTSFEYGQNTKLQVLNAEVDVNNDSIRYINSQRILSNAKRNLNVLLGRDVSTMFSVETKLEFNSIFNTEETLIKAKEQNVQMQQINKSIKLSEFDIKINKASLFPTLSIDGTYSLNKSDNDATFNYAEQLNKGLTAGLKLNWNIFDGGSTKTRIKNAKIYAHTIQIQKEQLANELERNVANAIELYNNSLFIMNSEEKNVETNQRNFNRTNEQFKLGQITTIEFRQAQVNLLNAKTNFNQAKFDAKNAELNLLLLTGDLLNVNL